MLLTYRPPPAVRRELPWQGERLKYRSVLLQPTCSPVPCSFATSVWAATSPHPTSHHVTPPHLTSHPITSHHITSHRIISHHITPHHITSNHITSHHTTTQHNTSHRITAHHITSHHITSHHFGVQGWASEIFAPSTLCAAKAATEHAMRRSRCGERDFRSPYGMRRKRPPRPPQDERTSRTPPGPLPDPSRRGT